MKYFDVTYKVEMRVYSCCEEGARLKADEMFEDSKASFDPEDLETTVTEDSK